MNEWQGGKVGKHLKGGKNRPGVTFVVCLDADDVAERGAEDARVALVINPGFAELKRKIPGGRPEEGETIEAAAIREMEEETGIKVLIDENTSYVDQDRGNHVARIYFTSGDLSTARHEGDENGDPIVVVTHHTLREVLSGKANMLYLHQKALEALVAELTQQHENA